MSTESERQGLQNTPPTQSTTPGEGVTSIKATTSAAAYDLTGSKGFYNRDLDLTAHLDDIWVTFGLTSSAAIDKSFAGGTTIATATKAENGVPIRAGTSMRVRLSRTVHKVMHVQANSANSVLIISTRSGKRTG